jgi:hypothetical protein
VKSNRTGFQPKNEFCRNNKGNLIGDNTEVRRRRAEYFKNMFEITEGKDEYDSEQVYSRAELQIAPPDLEGVQEAIYSIKNNKAPRIVIIPIELIKEGGVNLHKRLHTVITRVWKKEEMPDDWKIALFCPIHKKGDKTYCKNYKGIALLGVV